MTKIDRYLLRSNLGLFVGLTGLALAILMLERLIRLAEMLSGAQDAAFVAMRMIANLVPHYVELALPGAFLIAIILNIDRLSRSGEIVALMSTGTSLFRIARPYMVLGGALAVVSILISGFLQPVTRYNYRQILYDLQESSIIAAFQESRFVQFKDRTIWTDSVDFSGRTLGATFIIETAPDGTRRFLTGSGGALVADADGAWSIALHDGMIGRLAANIENGQGDRVQINTIDWLLPTNEGAFRIRGDDQRELTLSELMSGSYAGGGYQIDPLAAAADLQNRLSRAALLLVLPLLGVVLGLNLGRNPRAGGVAIGILALLVVQKLLEFGMLKAERGVVPAWFGLWSVVVAVACVAVVLFWRAAIGKTAVPSLWPITAFWRPAAKPAATTGG